MSRLDCGRGYWPRTAAVLGVLLAAQGLAGAAGSSGPAWEACRDRVMTARQAAGRRDYGDPAAYTGATGAGALAPVVGRCGYRDRSMDSAFCDDLYEQVYPACRQGGLQGLSMAGASWVAVLDPRGPVLARLRRACDDATRIDRAAFGRRVCGE